MHLPTKSRVSTVFISCSWKNIISGHVFYRLINWERLERLDIQPPFKPRMVHWTVSSWFNFQSIVRRASTTLKIDWKLNQEETVQWTVSSWFNFQSIFRRASTTLPTSTKNSWRRSRTWRLSTKHSLRISTNRYVRFWKHYCQLFRISTASTSRI